MKRLLKSALVAFLLLGAANVTRGQGNFEISGPFVSRLFFGVYEGAFYSRVLQFDNFSFSVFPNGYVSGYLHRNFRGIGPRSYTESTAFKGTLSGRGAFSGSFSHQGKDYFLVGTIDRAAKRAILLPSARRSSAKLGKMVGSFWESDFAPRGPALNIRLELSGVFDGAYIDFSTDGDFNIGTSSEDRGTYEYVKQNQNLARITLDFDFGDTEVLLVFFYAESAGILYNTSTGLFYYFNEDAGGGEGNGGCGGCG